jgi:CRISPR-associated protein Csm2
MGRAQPQQYGNKQQQSARDVDYKAIIVDENPDKLVEAARALAEDNKGVSSSQIRGLFTSIRQIQLSWSTDPKRAYRQAKLLQPRVAYAADRNSIGTLKDVVDHSIALVSGSDEERRKRYSNFVDFFEAIVAYHKAFGGKK